MPQARNTPDSPAAHPWTRHLAIGKQVADRHPAARVAYISGSIIEGFGTPRSDLDIFLLTDAAAPVSVAVAEAAVSSEEPVATYQADGYLIELDYAEDIPTDTEIWPIEVLAHLPDELAGIDLDDWGAAGAVPEAKLNLAHRLRIGLPVAGRPVRRPADRFDWDRLARILRNR